jgi:hypothetical protein
VKGVKAKGWDSCYQKRDQGVWEFITTNKKLDLQVSKVGLLCWCTWVPKEIACILCKYHDACLVNTHKIFCVQVKNKPCVEYISIMHFISWIHSRGSETEKIMPKFTHEYVYKHRHDMDANNKGMGQRQSLCAYACECRCPYLCPCPWQLSSSIKIWVFGYNTYWTPLRKIFLCNFCHVYFNKQLSVHTLRHGHWN